MKKLFTFIFLMFIGVLAANCNEVDYVPDKMTIKNLDVKVSIVGYKKYKFEEKYNTELIFGDLPGTHYFVRDIPLSGTLNYGRKSINYKATMDGFNVDSDTYFAVDNLPNGDFRIKVGDEYELFRELEDFTLLYDLSYTGKEWNADLGFNCVIAEGKYEIEKTNFVIVLPVNSQGKKISFSLDGKKFSKNIEGLTYKLEDPYVLTGTYNKTLKTGEKLSVIIEDAYDVIAEKRPFRESIVYISLGVGSICLLGIVAFILRRKKK